MNRRSFIKLAAAAMTAVCVPTSVLPLPAAAPMKVIAKIGPFSARELLGQWVCEKIEEDMINALCGLGSR